MIDFKQVQRALGSTTARMALSYLAIIMLMSIAFSVVIYAASAHELGRPARPLTNQSQDIEDRLHIDRDPIIRALLNQRAEEGRQELLRRLLILNLIVLAGGGVLSYFLARRTLEPIERNMEAQAQFVSDASHELRTPLTALQTTNEVALRKPKLTEAESRDLLAHNVAEVAKLQALTNGLLKLARTDGNSLARTSVSLQAIASDAMNNVVSAAQAKKISIDDKVPAMNVLGDQGALAQALTILLDNAIKYSPDHTSITLSATKHGKNALLSVTDQGHGISPKDLPHIFDRFYRADQSRGKLHTNGYGIGLALAKKIIHQHDGEIVAVSTPGKGSTFTIRLPLA